MADPLVSAGLAAAGVVAIVWGAEHFAENLARAATRLGVSTFALALLLAGAEAEELATAVTATPRHAPRSPSVTSSSWPDEDTRSDAGTATWGLPVNRSPAGAS